MPKTFLWLLFCAFLLALLAPMAIYLMAKKALAPAAGEWAVPVNIPLRAGPLGMRLQFQASVPALLRLAGSPRLRQLAGRWAHGKSLQTRAGPTRLVWLDSSHTLLLHCAPCSLHTPALGSEPLQLQALQLSVRLQDQGQLAGEVSSGQVHATWQGTLTDKGLRLVLHLPATPIADLYALLGSAIPEARLASIEGELSLSASLDLPDGSLSISPLVSGFQVSGLGTQALANARSACHAGTPPPGADSWLARAVIAAEDQRFYEHSGYDITEFSAALSRNQQGSGPPRGASTLSQQLAKLLLTGDDRSPVRKLRELLYAVEMEQTLGKNRILRLYLENAPWGTGLCGAEAAARHYFKRPASQLSPTQAAWLAAMLHNPGLEAGRWASTGQINVPRTQRVILGMRPLGSSQRLRLAQKLGEGGLLGAASWGGE